MNQALIFLIKTIADLFVMIVIARFLLQFFRADFHNPLSQAVLQLTSPLVVPVRKLLPAIGKIDTATVAVVIVLEVAFVLFLTWFVGIRIPFVDALIFGLIRSVLLTLKLFTFAIFISVILSWINPGPNPLAALFQSLAEPVMRPFRRYIPPIGGLDLSPLVALLLIVALSMVVGEQLPGFLR